MTRAPSWLLRVARDEWPTVEWHDTHRGDGDDPELWGELRQRRAWRPTLRLVLDRYEGWTCVLTFELPVSGARSLIHYPQGHSPTARLAMLACRLRLRQELERWISSFTDPARADAWYGLTADALAERVKGLRLALRVHADHDRPTERQLFEVHGINDQRGSVSSRWGRRVPRPRSKT